MTVKRVLTTYAIIMLAIGLPFVFIHLAASPDDAPISPLQHVVAALANFAGPWGVVIVTLVDFPNAGLRSFSWALAGGLTALGLLLTAIPVLVRVRPVQYVSAAFFALFLVVWFAVGLRQIADGLL